MSHYDHKERRVLAIYASIFILLAAGIIFTGYISYKGFEDHFLVQEGRQLSSIAELKVDELVDWRNGRLADAEALRQNRVFRSLVQAYFENPQDELTREQIQNWLENYKIYPEYDRVRLLDAQGQTRLSTFTDLAPVSSTVAQYIPEVMQSNKVVMVDFYRSNLDQEIELAILIPITVSQSEDQIIGLVAISITPQVYLYPFINEWPSESATAETLLVRRDGDNVLFLNALRFKPDAALTLYIPLTDTEYPAVKAVLGKTGVEDGLDYRGEQVFADMRPVPDSPWFLISKMDSTEVYAPMRARLLQTFWLAVMTILVTGAGLMIGWRQRRVQYYRAQAKTQEALLESEAFIRAVMDNLPIGVAVNSLDPSVNFTYMNDNFPKHYRTTREALADPDVFWDVVYEDAAFREKMRKRILDDCATGDLQRMIWVDIPIHRKGEDATYISARNIPVPGKQLMISTVWDVTERKQAEEQTRKIGQHYQSLIEKAPDGIVLLSAEGAFKFVSPSARRMFGYSISDEIVDSPADYTHPDDLPMVLSTLVKLLEDPSYVPTLQYRYIDRKGNWIWVESTFSNMLADPNVQSIVINFHDITDRKQVEMALQESENKYRALVQNLQVGVVVHGSDTRILFSNPMASQLLGLTQDQMLGKAAIDPAWCFVREDGTRCPLEEYPVNLALASKSPITNLVLGMVCPDREGIIWAHCDARQVWDQNDSLQQVVVTFFDITDRKRAEQQLGQYADKLEEMVNQRTQELSEAQEQLVRQERLAVLGQLAGSMGHELRNPLGVISNAIYFLKMSQPDASDQIKEYLTIIENEARTSDKIITDLLDFARIKSVDRKAVSVSELIHRTLDRFPAPEQVDVILDIPLGLPLIFADPHHVVQILGNLTTNACQSLPSTGGSIEISAALHENMVAIAVLDNGSGIPPENIKKLFEPLFTTKTKGIGLGLAVSKKLAEANDGRIEVRSEAGKGSTFTVWLPAE